MLIIFKKDIRVANSYKAILTIILLLFSFMSNAQEDEKKVTVTADTAEIIQPPPEEDHSAGVTDAGKGKYFHRLWDTLRVQQRSVPADEVKKMKEDEDFWYANTNIPRKKKPDGNVVPEKEKENGKKVQRKENEPAVKEQRQEESSDSSIGQQSWFQTLIWVIIIGGFAAFLIIYLTGMNVRLFRKKNIKVTDQDEEELNTEDIFAINYQKEIDKAAASGNNRLAIRLMFLRLLRNMSDKNIIRYKQDKTNFDYLMELQPTNYYNHFFRITRNYEYSWYGKFQVNEDAYQVIRSDFDRLEKELR